MLHDDLLCCPASVVSGKAKSLWWNCTSLTLDSKSQIAIQYCHKYKSEQPDSHVFWVHCGSVARFDQGYKEIARKLKLPGLHDPAVGIVKSVYDWLSEDDSGLWLLVLDNADDQEMFFGSSGGSTSQDVLQQQLGPLTQYLPRSALGSTLITTRDRRVGERFAERDKPIFVLPLEAEEAKSMLLSRLPDHLGWTAAEVFELLESLQRLPLAITQAASYISEECVTVARYLELLRPGNADSKALLAQDYYDSRRHRDIHNSVFQTWKLSFDQIRKQVPRAAEVLSMMCVLDKQSISRKLLHDEGENQVVFDRALATLKNFSMIQEENSQQTYEIHRLVQLSTQWWLEERKTLAKWQERALEVLVRECPSRADLEDWKAWESISPHISVFQGYHFEHEKQLLQYAGITSRMGEYNLALGRYEIALKMEEAALTVQQELLGKEHPDTLISMNVMASVLNNQGKYEEAEEMHQQVLRLRKIVLGKEHPNTLKSMNNLANVLSNQGKYEEAKEIHQQVFGLWRTIRGKEHPDTLISMNNLANVLNDQGKYKEAEEMHQQALRLMEIVLGKEHPGTLASMNNLANVLKNQGKYEKAEVMHQRTLGLKETVLGKEHPRTLASICNLANVLSNQKRYSEASVLYQRALNGYGKTLSTDHPTVQACQTDYTRLLNEMQEDIGEEDTLFMDCVETASKYGVKI
jgi:tetratricopeptide (TPR) repeat protein